MAIYGKENPKKGIESGITFFSAKGQNKIKLDSGASIRHQMRTVDVRYSQMTV